jgi:hypothetical protein
MQHIREPHVHRTDIGKLLLSVAAIAMLVAAAITSWLLQS